jgi:putative acetyltransferase
VAVRAGGSRWLDQCYLLRCMPSVIREEAPGDAAAIHRLNTTAFDTDAEAKLVDALRAAGALTLSLVAETGGEIVGHIAFSPVVVDSGRHTSQGVGLAPMAVAPAYQRQGIGGRLIDDGLRRLRDAGQRFCVVLGHAEYYPRHGFARASAFGVRWERPVPDDVFFIRELTPGGLAGVSGTVRYRPEFDAV